MNRYIKKAYIEIDFTNGKTLTAKFPSTSQKKFLEQLKVLLEDDNVYVDIREISRG